MDTCSANDAQIFPYSGVLAKDQSNHLERVNLLSVGAKDSSKQSVRKTHRTISIWIRPNFYLGHLELNSVIKHCLFAATLMETEWRGEGAGGDGGGWSVVLFFCSIFFLFWFGHVFKM